MEAVAVVGLASNIIQIIGVAREVTSTAKEIRKSFNGLSRETERFRQSAEVIRKPLENVIDSPDNTKIDDAFRDYAKSMRKYVDQYLSKLDGLKVKDPNSRLQSGWAAIKGLWMKGELEESMARIDHMGSQVAIYIVTEYVPTISSKLDGIKEDIGGAESSLTNHMNQLANDIQSLGINCSFEFKKLQQALRQWFCDREALKNHRRCLKALYFEQLRHREDEVTEAEAQTFDWFFDPGCATFEEQQRSRFREWLSSADQDKNVFWVSGKPGAGKSTLMKYLSHHASLPNHLQSWIGSRKLIRADYYFWKSGTKLQRSTVGMLRSLLYQVLRNERRLIDDVFTDDEWNTCGKEFKFSQKTLRDGLSTALAKGLERGLCFMFFIDGLDEFDDRDEYSTDVYEGYKLISLLRMFYNRPGVKLCVSSRLWNEFKEEFGQDVERNIRVDELTRGDIATFIKLRLEHNATFQRLAQEDKDYLELVTEMTTAAQGVFLWVHLATLSLLDGLTNADRIWNLQERLRRLPRELGDLYEHILKSIPNHYRIISAQMLLAASSSKRDDFQHTFTPLVCLYIDEYERSVACKASVVIPSQLLKNLVDMSKRLRAQCKGLLEADIKSPNSHEQTERQTEQETQLGAIFGGRMEFSHRTVVDFLRSEAGRGCLLNTIGKDVDMNLVLVKSGLTSAKNFLSIFRDASCNDIFEKGKGYRSPYSLPYLAPRYYLIHDELDLLSERAMSAFFLSVENLDIDVAWPLWVELERLVNLPTLGGKQSFLDHWINTMHLRFHHPPLKATIDHLAVRYHCLQYLTRKLTENPLMLMHDSNTYPLLLLAVQKAEFKSNEELDLFRLLFQHGADPNEEYADTTIWKGLFERNMGRGSWWDRPLFYPVMRIFVENGADIAASVGHIMTVKALKAHVSNNATNKITFDTVVSAFFNQSEPDEEFIYIGVVYFTAPLLSMAQHILQHSNPEHADMHEIVDPVTVTRFMDLEIHAATHLIYGSGGTTAR